MRIRAVFLGSRPLGKYALRLLAEHPEVHVIGSVVRDYQGRYWTEDPWDFTSPQRITHEQLAELDFDLGLSVNYWKRIEPEILARARFGFYNVHHSYNLCYRGRNMTSWAIVRARELDQWYHGTTLHRMAPEIDAGEVVASYCCPISERDTALTLFQAVEGRARDMLADWLPRLWGRLTTTQPHSGEWYSALPPLDMNWPALKLYDHVRALTFLQPPECDGSILNINFGVPVADAGEGRIVYRGPSGLVS